MHRYISHKNLCERKNKAMFEIVDLKRDLNMKLADQRIEMKAILR